ncbi:diguanylate cyclase [Demequina iriomotensis]|uniref:diguanylate cyclase n=1 Tax=Demequina iriomotensis TaxID=1536641 RepID=UPI001470454C|nr:diguanylate cyclase [Demequina iriomotensis]
MTRLIRRRRTPRARGVAVGITLVSAVLVALVGTAVVNAYVAERTLQAATEDTYTYVGDLMAERVSGVADAVADVVVGTVAEIERHGDALDGELFLDAMVTQLDREPAAGSIFVADPDGRVMLLAPFDDGYVTLEVTPIAGNRTHVVRTEYDADLEVITAREADDDYTVTDRTWFRAGLEADELVWSDPYISVRTGEVAVSPVLAARVDGEVVAIVGADLDLDLLGGLLEDIPLGGDARAFILASDGSVIAAPAGARDDVRRALDAGMTVPDAADLGLPQGTLVPHAPEDGTPPASPPPEAAGEGSAPPDVSNNVVVERAMDPDTGIDWVLHLDADPAALAPAVSSMKRVTMVVTGVSIALVVAAALIALRLYRPLRMMRQRAETDALTRLANRYDFQRRGRAILRAAQAGGDDALMVLFDLDGLKRANDEFGHDAGDTVLAAVGDALRESVRSRDMAARIGGDEFAAIITLRDGAQPVDIARRLRDNVARVVSRSCAAGAQVGVTAGFAVASEAGFDLRPLQSAADQALVAGKKVHKGRTYAPGHEQGPGPQVPAGSVPLD